MSQGCGYPLHNGMTRHRFSLALPGKLSWDKLSNSCEKTPDRSKLMKERFI